jgi:hypothetical protein
MKIFFDYDEKCVEIHTPQTFGVIRLGNKIEKFYSLKEVPQHIIVVLSEGQRTGIEYFFLDLED